MTSPRSPRFKRAPPESKIHLTSRDESILRLVHEHRFVTSRHFIALISGSTQQLLRRLRLLFHHGYLERPRAQIEYFHQGGSRSMVYGLGNKGAKLLKQKFGCPLPHLRFNEKNQSVRRLFLEHALAVSDVMVAVQIAVRDDPSTSFISERELGNGKGLRWRVRLTGRHTLGIVPDRVFALDHLNAKGETHRSWYFLECDRGTMPVVRKNHLQTSMYRKFLAYHATWRQGVLKRKFGFDRFRVLIVTTSKARETKLLEACAKLPGGHGLFLFSHKAALGESSDILRALWHDGRNRPATILPPPANVRLF